MSGRCVHGADGARIEAGRLFSPLCERCAKDRQAREERERLEAAWSLPAFGEQEVRPQGYISLMPEE